MLNALLPAGTNIVAPMKRFSFYRLTPHHSLSSNPLFALETRHLLRGGSAESLFKLSRNTGLITGGVLLLVWLAIMLLTTRFTRYSTSLEFALTVAGLSLLAELLLDFSSISNALNSISGDVVAGRWELLRLTMLTSKQIVAAKHGAAQARTWRLTSLIVAARIASILMIALTVPITFLDRTGVFAGMPALPFIFAALTCGGVALIFSLEPFWRMRAVTALGIAASSRGRQPISAVLVSIGTIFAFWLGQGMVVAALFFGAGLMITPLVMLETSLGRGVIFSPLFLLASIMLMVYGYYSLIQTFALRRAERFTARRD